MEGIDTVAQLIAMAAITAPKTSSTNFVQVKLLQGAEVQQLGQAMITFGQKSHKGNFDRDGLNVLNSEAVVLIGIQDAQPATLDCAACGYATCSELSAQTPLEGEFRPAPLALIAFSIWGSPSARQSRWPAYSI